MLLKGKDVLAGAWLHADSQFWHVGWLMSPAVVQGAEQAPASL